MKQAHKSAAVEDWLQAHARPPTEIDLTLERVQAVRAQMRLNLPSPVVIVGGTNGKGSVCHLLMAIMEAAGFKVGCYTSPHLFHFGERIKINSAPADESDILQALKRVAAAAQQVNVSLSYFELTTLAAADLFTTAACEVIILEVGLGGRLDAVNIFDADVAVITNIGMDHMEYLGNSRDEIAVEKAGIARCGKPVVVGDLSPPPALVSALQDKGAVAFYNGRDFCARQEHYWHYHGTGRHFANLPVPTLPGAHQRQNAATALCALECLAADYWPGSGAVRRGLHAVELPGRGQVLAGQPVTVLDVAHNAAAAAALERQLFDMGYYPRTTAVLGMLARKDIGAFVHALKRRIDHWHIARPTEGDLPAADIATAVQAAGGEVTVHASVAEAAGAARQSSGKSGRMVVTGSFLTVADYMHCRANE